MTSPPYNQQYPSAISPPYPSSAQPLKRRQSDMPSSAPAIKRRKASMLSINSNSSHPLRQTSFPPEQSSQTPRYSRSPSMDTMSLISGSVAGASKKKKRKSKNAAANEDASMASGKAKSTDGRGKRRESRDQTAEDEDEGPDGEGMAIETVARTQEERQKEIEHRAMLVRAFDDNQFRRYEAWRSSKLPDAVVRRIVNQTLSQSAPASVILAIRSVAKIFAGEMIEGARRVQTQWVEAEEEDQTSSNPSPPAEGDKSKENETRRGPLLPDHLRESIRRYKAEGDGGLVGQLGLWQLQTHNGVERFGLKVGGKRLLK